MAALKKISLGLVLFLTLARPVQGDTPAEVRNLSNRRYFEETLGALEKAKQSIFLVMYQLPLDPSNPVSPVTRLIQALIDARRRGVEVRVILDQEIRSDRRGGTDEKPPRLSLLERKWRHRLFRQPRAAHPRQAPRD